MVGHPDGPRQLYTYQKGIDGVFHGPESRVEITLPSVQITIVEAHFGFWWRYDHPLKWSKGEFTKGALHGPFASAEYAKDDARKVLQEMSQDCFQPIWDDRGM